MLIQHNPNEGLKLTVDHSQRGNNYVLIQHNPNEGLKLGPLRSLRGAAEVLIQHNPNEGLKPVPLAATTAANLRAHSAQPERGIETHRPPQCCPVPAACSFSTTRTRD